MAGSTNEQLAAEAQGSLALLDAVQEDKLFANLLPHSKGVVLLWGTKIGLGVGGRWGQGIVISRLPPLGPDQPERWSAPLWVKVRVAELGLCFGYATSRSWLLMMNDSVLKELGQLGSHRLVGVDQTFALGSALATQTMACKSDVIGLAAGEHGMFGADISCGAMMDFSLARGAMSVDVAKIAEVYGGGADARGVLAGEVPAPKEMGPLYDRLDQIVAHGVQRVSAHATRASLARMTAGYDPDRRVLSAQGSLVHTGDSDAALAPQGRSVKK